MHTPLTFTFFLFLGSFVQSQSTDSTDCGLLGPVYPLPADYERSKAIQAAQSDWAHALNESFQQYKTVWGPVNSENTSISIGVFSTQSDHLLAEFHHVPTRPELRSHLTGGKLDGDSLYRIGSVTKLLSVYTALSKLRNEHWSQPIIDFIPELEHTTEVDPVHSFNWSSITLANLVNHMAGLPRDFSLTDLSSNPDGVPPFFPMLNGSEVIRCSGPGQPPCSREESLRLMLEQNPLAPSWNTPVYSNNGFVLLGLALENITGESFDDTFKTSLVEPLNLTRTFLQVPKPASDPNAVLFEAQDGDWLKDLGLIDPAGAAWSSLYDLSAIGRSILSSSILPPHVQRQWLKPETHTDHPASSVGKGWEIFRMSVPIEPDSNATRLADLYTKNGGLVGYNAEIILSPDHGIGIVVLVATLDDSNPMPNDAGTLWSLVELATSIWIPAAEAAAREAATANYAGTFASKDGLNSSITLAITPDRRGMDITRLIYNNTDYLAYGAASMGRAGGQLQYMDLRGDGELAFRAVWQQAKQPLGGPTAVFLRECIGTWTGVDGDKYGGFGDDEFIISVDKDGKAVGIEVPFFRATFSRRLD